MRNNARRIWASTPQNCATTHRVCFEKRWYLSRDCVWSKAIYRLFA